MAIRKYGNNPLGMFISFFVIKQKEIKEIKDPFFRKILYMPMFDSLSKIPDKVEGNNYNNNKRFNDFVEKFSGWGHWKLVSTTQLYRLLHKKGFSNVNITQEISKKLDAMTNGQVPKAREFDEDIGYYLNKFPDIKVKIGNRDIYIPDSCTLLNIFYHSFRCNLVHDFREHEQATNLIPESLEPYYMHFAHQSRGKPDKGYWALGIPNGFIDKIFINCLNNLAVNLNKNNVNPYDCYGFDY